MCDFGIASSAACKSGVTLISTSSLPCVRSILIQPSLTCCGPRRTISPRRDKASRPNSITRRCCVPSGQYFRYCAISASVQLWCPLLLPSLMLAMPSVGSTLSIVGTANFNRPRIALSQCRLADRLSISANIFQDVVLAQESDALIAVLDTKPLDNAPPGLARILGELVLPLIRTVVVDHQRIDGAGQGSICADIRCVGLARERLRVGCHKLFRARQAGKRDRRLTATPKVIAHTSILALTVRETVYVPKLDR